MPEQSNVDPTAAIPWVRSCMHTAGPLGPVASVLLICRNGEAFSDSCLKALEPEDVTLGLVVGKTGVRRSKSRDVWTNISGAVLNSTLRRTDLIHTHGLHLSTQVDPQTLERQVCGCGGEMTQACDMHEPHY